MLNFKVFVSKIYENRNEVSVPLPIDKTEELYTEIEKAIKNSNIPQPKRSGSGIEFHPVTQIIQTALNFLGYDLPIFGVDGKFGNETAKAFVKFKEDNNLPASGYDLIKKANVTDSSLNAMIKDLKKKKMSNTDIAKYHLSKKFTKLNKPTLSKITGNLSAPGLSGYKKKNADLLINTLMQVGITNPYTIKAILSVVDKESGFNPAASEVGYTKTSNSRIRKIFGKRVSDLSDSKLDDIKKDKIKLWDRLYGIDDPTGRGKRYGNNERGDGYKYRGRGFNQLTFKSNYEKYNKLLKKNGFDVDIVKYPEKLGDPKISAIVTSLYFLNALNNNRAKAKYGTKDPNSYTDFTTALKAAVNANAGWGKNIENTETYRRAVESSKKFSLDEIKRQS